MISLSQLSDIVAPLGLMVIGSDRVIAGVTPVIEGAAAGAGSGWNHAWDGAVVLWHTPAADPSHRVVAVGVPADAVEAVRRATAELDIDPRVREAIDVATPLVAIDADRLYESFSAAAEELAILEEERESFEAATEAVEQAYEMIDVLHNVGAAVSDPMRQHELIAGAAGELRETLGFGWVIAAIGQRNAELLGLQEPTITSAHRSVDAGAVLASLGSLNVIDRVPPAGRVESWPFEHAGKLGRYGVIEPILVDGTPVGALIAGGKLPGAPEVSSFDQRMLQSAASYIGPMMRVAELFEAQQRLFFGTVKALTGTLDAKDPYTRGHSERVAHLACRLAEAIGYDAAQVERVRLAGLLHDIGKIGVPEHVLCKAGRLNILPDF